MTRQSRDNRIAPATQAAQLTGADRLDKMLVRAGYFDSQTRAADAIRQGNVRVNNVAALKPAAIVDAGLSITVDKAPSDHYVSRGALKLIAALDTFGIDPNGRAALDIGASTGGFSQVLLERGAAHVCAVDVGHGQLHQKLRDEPRLHVLEKTNARDLTAAHLPEPIDLITCDVSFISLTKALPAAMARAAPGGFLVALIKPQFELGPEAIGKGGLVTVDATALAALCDAIAAWLVSVGWRILGLTDSPIRGGDGNREFLIGAQKQ